MFFSHLQEHVGESRYIPVLENRPVLAHELRADLTVAAMSGSAPHSSFHRDIDAVSCMPVPQKGARHESHHDLGAADVSPCAKRIKVEPAEKGGDQTLPDAQGSSVSVFEPIDAENRVHETGFLPGEEIMPEDHVVGGPGAVYEDKASDSFSVPEAVQEERPEGGKAYAARNDEDVLSFQVVHRPPPTERAPQQEAIPRFQTGDVVGHITHMPDGVRKKVLPGLSQGAHGKGGFLEPRKTEHVELARLEKEFGLGFQAKKVRARISGLRSHLHQTSDFEFVAFRPHRIPSPSVAMISLAMCVRSIWVGHQVMQRPHPIHPKHPNCSHHVASLCVTNCRSLAARIPRKLEP